MQDSEEEKKSQLLSQRNPRTQKICNSSNNVIVETSISQSNSTDLLNKGKKHQQFQHYLDEQINCIDSKIINLDFSIIKEKSLSIHLISNTPNELDQLKIQIQAYTQKLIEALDKNQILQKELQSQENNHHRSERKYIFQESLEQTIILTKEILYHKQIYQELNVQNKEIVKSLQDCRQEICSLKNKSDDQVQKHVVQNTEYHHLQIDLKKDVPCKPTHRESQASSNEDSPPRTIHRITRAISPEIHHEASEIQTLKSQLNVYQKNRCIETKQLQDQILDQKEKQKLQDSLIIWLRSKLQKYTNQDINPQSDPFLNQKHKQNVYDQTIFNDKRGLTQKLEELEVKEHNLDNAIKIKCAEFNTREKEYQEKIKFYENQQKIMLKQDSKKRSLENVLQLQQQIETLNGTINSLNKQVNGKTSYIKEVEISYKQYKSRQGQLLKENNFYKENNLNLSSHNKQLYDANINFEILYKIQNSDHSLLQQKYDNSLQEITQKELFFKNRLQQQQNIENQLNVKLKLLQQDLQSQQSKYTQYHIEMDELEVQQQQEHNYQQIIKQEMQQKIDTLQQMVKTLQQTVKDREVQIKQNEQEKEQLRRQQDDIKFLDNDIYEDRIYKLERKVRITGNRINDSTDKQSKMTEDSIPQEFYVEIEEEILEITEIQIDRVQVQDELDESLIDRLTQLRTQIHNLDAHLISI